MSYQYHGTANLIALPNRTVQTYPSGLVRVERSFVCRKDSVTRFRNTIKVNEPMPFDDGAPAIDGLYIFPEPQEFVRDDGFVEFRVTAYGRYRLDAELEEGAVQGTYFYDFVTETITNEGVSVSGNSGFGESLNSVYNFRRVLSQGESLSSLLEPPEISNPQVIPFTVIPADQQSIRLELRQVSSVNFGLWSEWAYTYEARLTAFRQTVIDLTTP